MNPLFLLLLSSYVASTLVFAFNVTLSIETDPPYVVGVNYTVTWIIQEDPGSSEPDVKSFYIVKERPLQGVDNNQLSEDAQEVGLSQESLSSIGTVQILFYEPTLYSIVAYHSEKKDQTGYEGEFGRLDNIEVGPGLSTSSSLSVSSTVAAPTPSVSVLSGGPSSNPDTSTPTSINQNTFSRANHTAVIVGSVLGASIGICVLVLLVYMFLVAPRLRKREYASQLGIFVKASLTTPRREKDLESTLVDTTSLMAKDRHFSVDSDSKTTSSLPSIFTDATPPVRFVPLTDRQMELQDRIHNLKSKLISLKGDSDEFGALMKRIDVLEHLQNSDWALDRTDEIPPGLV